MVDATAMTEDAEEEVDALLFAGPGEEGDGLADGLVGFVAEDASGGGVPGGDDAGQGHAEDGVVRGFDDGGQPALRDGGIVVRRGGGRDVGWIGDATAHSIFTASSVTAHFIARDEALLSNGGHARVKPGIRAQLRRVSGCKSTVQRGFGASSSQPATYRADRWVIWRSWCGNRYLWAFSWSRVCLRASSFWPASASLPAAVRRW